MDDRLKKALEFSDLRTSLFNQKENIKLKMDTLRTYSINGGIFKSTPDLISFVKNILDSGHEKVVLIDINGNPIEISDIQTFYDDILSKYFEATNFYYIEYSKLKKSRTIRDQFKEVFENDN